MKTHRISVTFVTILTMLMMALISYAVKCQRSGCDFEINDDDWEFSRTTLSSKTIYIKDSDSNPKTWFVFYRDRVVCPSCGFQNVDGNQEHTFGPENQAQTLEWGNGANCPKTPHTQQNHKFTCTVSIGESNM